MPDRENEEFRKFWVSCAEHILVMPLCLTCGKLRWYPRSMCHRCHSLDWDWTPVSGKGRIFTYSVVRRAFDPGFADEIPFVVALVELDEEPEIHLVTRISGCRPEDVSIGIPVVVDFQKVDGDLTLPYFTPISAAELGAPHQEG
jgi:uncharacterized OB-fold protein